MLYEKRSCIPVCFDNGEVVGKSTDVEVFAGGILEENYLVSSMRAVFSTYGGA